MEREPSLIYTYFTSIQWSPDTKSPYGPLDPDFSPLHVLQISLGPALTDLCMYIITCIISLLWSQRSEKSFINLCNAVYYKPPRIPVDPDVALPHLNAS